VSIIEIDDGTLDTVLKCTKCGEVFRGNWMPGESPEDSYTSSVIWFVTDVEQQHVCLLKDDENV
jgi:hypothetical protein